MKTLKKTENEGHCSLIEYPRQVIKRKIDLHTKISNVVFEFLQALLLINETARLGQKDFLKFLKLKSSSEVKDFVSCLEFRKTPIQTIIDKFFLRYDKTISPQEAFSKLLGLRSNHTFSSLKEADCQFGRTSKFTVSHVLVDQLFTLRDYNNSFMNLLNTTKN